MCEEYEFEWYERARIAEQQRRERLRDAEPKESPKAPAPQQDVKEQEPVPA